MQKLIDEFDAAKNFEQQLKNQYDDADRKYKIASSLIEKLGDEEINWKESLKKNRADRENLVGDIIISSGIIAYLGVFTMDYRSEAVTNWVNLMKSF